MTARFIKNIKSLNNCGTFYDWPTGQIEFGRYNLLYGWNGSGKTTFSRIFHSLQKEDIVSELLQNNAAPSFQLIELDNSIINSSNLSGWKNNVLVFNSDFIKENVHTDNAEAEPVYHLGKDQGHALEELEEVKKQLKTQRDALSEKRTELSKQDTRRSSEITEKAKVIREAIALNGFNAGKLRPILEEFREKEIDTGKLKLSTENVQTQINIARNSNDKEPIQDKSDFIPSITLENLYNTIAKICRTCVAKVAIDELDKNDELREWVDTGHNLHKDRETCAYCASTISQQRKEILSQYFNDAYEKLIQCINAAEMNLGDFIKEINAITFPDPSRLYSELRESYKSQTDTANKARESFIEICKKLEVHLETKRSKMLTEELQIPPLEEVAHAQTAYIDGLKNVQSIISSHNERYDNFEKISQDAKRLIIDHYAAEHYNSYAALSSSIEKLQPQIEPLDTAIKKLERQEANLNAQLREHHIAEDRINELLASFLGRCDIKLVTNEKGYFIERENIRATNLSEGERTAIAFIYFIAKAEEKDFELEKSIVVIDDPISSLDTNALYAAGSFIRCHLEKASQLFILTHNYQFFREMYGWMNKLKKPKSWLENINYKRYIMLKCETGVNGKRASKAYPMDKTLENFESEYLFLFQQLYEAYGTVTYTGNDNPDQIAQLMLLPNIARRVLETFILFKFPDTSNDSVINLYNSIKPLNIESIPPEKISVLDRVLNKVSHGRVDGVEMLNMLDISETPKAVQYVVEFIKEADKLHFEGLLRATGCKEKAPPSEQPPNDNVKSETSKPALNPTSGDTASSQSG